MSPAATPSRIAACILLALCVALSGLLYRQIAKPPAATRTTAATGAAPAAETPAGLDRGAEPFPVFDPLMEAELSELVDRPLFVETRRPPSRDAEHMGAENVEMPVFVLRGVVLADRRRSALLQREDETALIHVVEGEELSGWKVSEVRRDMVVFTQDKDRVEIFLAELAPKGERNRRSSPADGYDRNRAIDDAIYAPEEDQELDY